MIEDLLIGMFFVLGALMLWHIIDDIAWRIRRWQMERDTFRRFSRLDWREPEKYQRGDEVDRHET